MSQDESNDDIPVLRDLVRHGRKAARQQRSNEDRPASDLTEAEIEAIAEQVVEQHMPTIRQAVVRAVLRVLREREKGTD